MTATHWEVFVGYSWQDILEGEPAEWTHHDDTWRSWVTAAADLERQFRAFEDDDCETCRNDAAESVKLLDALPRDQGLWVNIDGDDYVLAPVEVTHLPGSGYRVTLASAAETLKVSDNRTPWAGPYVPRQVDVVDPEGRL